MFAFAVKPTSQVQSRIRRLVDLTVPNLPPELRNDRAESRSNRALPALLCPWANNQPVAEQHAFVLTKDFSSDGVGIVLSRPFQAEQVLLGFWLNDAVMDEPWLFLGRAQCLQELGGGFWTLGVQLAEYVEPSQRTKCTGLAPLLGRLRA